MTPVNANSAAPRRVPTSPDEPTTLVELFERVMGRMRCPNLFNYKKDGQWTAVSSDDFLARARRLALGLYALGARYGDRVAIYSENCHEWTLADAACILAGAIDVPIYATQAAPQVQYILKDSEARLIFVAGREKVEGVRELLAGCPALEGVILFNPEGASELGALTLQDLETQGRQLEEKQPELAAQISAQVKPDDLATLIYTSGTTGEPKGVMLTHSNLVSNFIDCAEHMEFTSADSALSVLPYAHIYERTAMYMYIYNGIRVYYAESLDKIGANLREVSPTIFIGVPRLFEKIYEAIVRKANEMGGFKAKMFHWAVGVGKEHAKLTNQGQSVPSGLAFKYKLAWKLVLSKWKAGLGGRIRAFTSGGAALSPDVGYIFMGAGVPVLQGYGLTETSPVITASREHANRIGASGQAIRNVEIRIAADGEIEARGPNIMRGYYNKPEATREVFTADGFFKTGDIGHLDADGFLFITDRKKELFKTSGGKYLAPQPVEQKIKECPYVSQVVLIGNGRKFPSALIVPDWNQLEGFIRQNNLHAVSRAELCRHPAVVEMFEQQVTELTPDLAKFEKIKKIALLEHELTIESGELTPTLKLKRRVIDEKYKAVIDGIYSGGE
jgi:long-chain acyl-CoA synthetase